MNTKEKVKEVGDFLRARRQKLGLTQKQVGERMGINENTISRLESGYVEFGPVNLERMNRALEFTKPQLKELILKAAPHSASVQAVAILMGFIKVDQEGEDSVPESIKDKSPAPAKKK